MKLYGHFLSAPANMVRLAASAMDVDHEYIHVDLMKGEQNSPEYKAISRFGKVPALVDGDFELCESGAICKYLAATKGSDFYPNDHRQRAVVDQWMEYSSQHVRLAMSKILFNKFFAPMLDMPVDEASITEGQEMLGKQMPQVEKALSASSYLTGDEITLADVALVAAMEPFDMIGFSLNEYPAVGKWRQDIMSTDWYNRVHKNYAAEMQS